LHLGNTNLAYRVEEVREQTEKKQLEVRRGMRGRENEKKRKSKSLLWKFVNVRTCSVFMIVIGMCSLIVYNNIQLHEVTGEINRLSTEIRRLENENMHLTSRLENTISLHVIADIAQRELGLQKLDKYQIEYVVIFKENTIELTRQTPRDNFAARLSYGVKDMFRHIKEYIGGS
jgi:cell division protein FtsL